MTSLLSYPLYQALQTCLGAWLSDKEIQNLGHSLQVQTPAIGEQFWQSLETGSTTAKPELGLWIVLQGKVRLLDDREELLLTLQPGESFGEISELTQKDSALDRSHLRYSARASTDTQVAHLSEAEIRPLLKRFPDWAKALTQQAITQDLQLLISRHPKLQPTKGQAYPSNTPATAISPALLRQHCQSLKPQRLPDRARLPRLPDCPLFVIYNGKLRHQGA